MKIRWRKWGTIAIVLVAVVVHQTLLRWLAGVVVAEDPHQRTTAYAVFTGRLQYKQIATLYHGDPHVLLLFSTPPRRLEIAGLLPHRSSFDRMVFEAQGVPATAIQILPTRDESTWESVRMLGDWLNDHPSDRVAVLCDRFYSRRQRLILGRILGDKATRVDVVALVDPRFDESNWWKRKEGVLAFHSSLTLLSYNWISGEGEKRSVTWDPDVYEATLP